MNEHELEYIVAAILTAAALDGTHPRSAATAVERFKEVIGYLRETGGLPPARTLPHD